MSISLSSSAITAIVKNWSVYWLLILSLWAMHHSHGKVVCELAAALVQIYPAIVTIVTVI